MRHLDAERLSALADELPTVAETEHLAACALCAREAEAHRAVRAMGARSGGVLLDAPLTTWDSLAPSLRDAGVIRGAGAGGGSGGTVWNAARMRPWLRAAAAVALVAGGVAAGRFTAPGAAAPASTVASAGAPPAGVQTAGLETAAGTPIVSVPEALRVMERAEHDYRAAAAFIVANDTAARGDADRYRARLAGLSKVQEAVLEAVHDSPDDPVLNQYLLSTRSARQVTLQQLGNTLPNGVRLASY